VLLLDWFFSFDPVRKTLSYAPAGTILRILKTRKPLHPVDIFGKVEAPWRE